MSDTASDIAKGSSLSRVEAGRQQPKKVVAETLKAHGSKKDVVRPTLKTIANMANLGVTTVSKALKDAPDIAASTKERVRLIAEQIGYQPDKAALRLRTGKTNVISLIVNTDEEVDHMTSEFIMGVTRALSATAYNLVLTPYTSNSDPMLAIRHVVETKAADGVILQRTEPCDQRLAYLNEVGMPFATHGRSNMGLQHAYYDFDCVAFGSDAVHALAKLGCKRAAMIFPPMHLTYAQLMQQGMHQGLAETGLKDHPLRSITIEDQMEDIAKQVCAVLQKRTRPDGIICCNTRAAIAALNAIESAGLSVGEDVQVLSKQSTSNMLKWFGKPAYYIAEDFTAAGFAVASGLLGVLNGDPVTEHQTVGYTNILGESVL